MAEDAVLCEPVCGAEFPDNREFNREFLIFGPFSTILVSKTRTNSAVCSKIPYATEQGIVLDLTGNYLERRGNFTEGSAKRRTALRSG
jgi:hypothetical protein